MEQKQLDELDETPIEEYVEDVDEVEEFKAKKKAYKKPKKSPWREEDLEVTSATTIPEENQKKSESNEEKPVEKTTEKISAAKATATHFSTAPSSTAPSSTTPTTSHNPWADDDAPSEEKPSGMWWKVLVGVLAVILIFAVLLYGAGNQNPSPSTNPATNPPTPNLPPVTPSVAPATPQEPTPSQPAPPISSTSSITLKAKRWIFTPQTFVVKQGDHVELTITPENLRFTFAIPELGVEEYINKVTTVQFNATKKGTFRFICSSCEEYRGMEGTITIE